MKDKHCPQFIVDGIDSGIVAFVRFDIDAMIQALRNIKSNTGSPTAGIGVHRNGANVFDVGMSINDVAECCVYDLDDICPETAEVVFYGYPLEEIDENLRYRTMVERIPSTPNKFMG